MGHIAAAGGGVLSMVILEMGSVSNMEFRVKGISQLEIPNDGPDEWSCHGDDVNLVPVVMANMLGHFGSIERGWPLGEGMER